MSGYRYGEFSGGPDPLEPPYDVRAALDRMGDAVLDGANPADALRDLLRKGLPRSPHDSDDARGRNRGLDDILKRVREQRRRIRSRGRLDGTLEKARALLDKAVGQERAELFPDPSDAARMREAELDEAVGGPETDTAQAVQRLKDYDWHSPAARQTFEELRELLRREVLDTQFQGMREALANPDPEAMRRVQEMVRDLNEMLERDARGEHTQADFDRFMEKHGEFFPDAPRNLEELVDSLARRSAAAQRMLASMTPEQRAELAGLMDQALQDAGLDEEMARLGASLQARRPDLAWDGAERMTGESPLGMGDAVTALQELADLSDLEAALRQDYPGARLDDIDEEAVRRALGRNAVDDLDALKRVERELERQGYLQRNRGNLELTPKAVRRLGQAALQRVFASLDSGRRGDHDQRDAGAAGEYTGASRAWRFGDEQPIDVVRTVVSGVRRSAAGRGGPVKLSVEDFEVAETERRSAAAVCLLVDLSYSMALRGTWAVAKQTALALQTLVATRYPQDALQIIGFSNFARTLQPDELAGLDWDMVQGTNLHHALLVAGRHLDRHPEYEPVVLIVTDGEPTAHLRRNGNYWFEWPPSPETVELTLAEVDKMTRRHATLNVFMLEDETADSRRLREFVDEVARRNGGRVFSPSPERLGEYVVSDFLRARRRR